MRSLLDGHTPQCSVRARVLLVTVAATAVFSASSTTASAALIWFWRFNPISPAAVAADPALANMQSHSLMVTNSDGHWASAGLRITLPPGRAFYQTPTARFGGDTHPNPAFFTTFPDLEFDTYVSSARNQSGSNPPAILGPYPEGDPPISLGGASDPVPGRFSVTWGDPQATTGPGPGTYEILRITFPRDVGRTISPPGQTSQVAPDQTVSIFDPPEPNAMGVFLIVAAVATRARPRRRAR